MTYQNELKNWVEQGRKDNYNYLLIVYDNQDKDYFPVYFHFYSDIERYRENIISESKLVAKQDIKLNSWSG